MRWSTRSHGRQALGAAAVAAIAWSLVGAGSADAADVTELGWWTRNPLSSAGEGGFAVGAAPDGVTAVAAMRVDLGGGVDTLVLDVKPTTDGIALASLEVCTTPDTWSAAAPGAIDAAPLTSCAGDSVPFAPAGDGWRADVSSLVVGSSGIVSLGVVPTPGSGTVPFEVTFEAPAVRSTGDAASAPGSPSTPSASPMPAPAPSSSPSASPSFTPAPSRAPIAVGTSPSVTVAPAGPATPGAPAAEAAAPPTDDADGAGSTIELANSGLLGETEASAPRWGEALILVLIGFGVGAGVYGISRLSAARGARGATPAPA